MVGKIQEWIQNRPKLFGQKGKWDLPASTDIATWPKPMSILSGPEHPVHPARSFLKSVFPPYDRKLVESFMTRFEGQRRKGKGKRFFGSMNLLDIGNLIDGSMLGRRKGKGKPRKIEGIQMSIIG